MYGGQTRTQCIRGPNGTNCALLLSVLWWHVHLRNQRIVVGTSGIVHLHKKRNAVWLDLPFAMPAVWDLSARQK
jgi:hypothetical protein